MYLPSVKRCCLRTSKALHWETLNGLKHRQEIGKPNEPGPGRRDWHTVREREAESKTMVYLYARKYSTLVFLY